MSKDNKTGKSLPSKGKPSGAGKEQGMGIHPTPPEKLEEYLERDDILTDGEQLSDNVPLKHRNRITSKIQKKINTGANGNKKVPASKNGKTISVKARHVVTEELPGVLSREAFTSLAAFRHPDCISIYIPFRRDDPVENNKIAGARIMDTLEAAERLLDGRMSRDAIKEMMIPAYGLLETNDLSDNQPEALALFIAPGFFSYIRMQIPITEEMIVENSFYVTPLLPVLIRSEYFFLLVISKKQVRLFRGDAFSMHHVPVAGLPNGVSGMVTDDNDENLSARDESTTYAGGKGQTKKDISVFFEAADDVLFKNVLHEHNVPLLLAGVEYLIPLYKSVCDYPFIWQESLTGSFEHENIESLYRAAMPLMKPHFTEKQEKALVAYGNLLTQGLSTPEFSEIIPAAYYGRIASLLVKKDSHQWGYFDEKNNKLEMHSQQKENSEDLVDNAVIRVLLSGGDVFLLSEEEMPMEKPLCAVFRY